MADSGVYSVVFIANTGRDDQPLPDYLKEALERFEQEKPRPRYCLVAHDLVLDGTKVSSAKLGLTGKGVSIQYSLLEMLGKFNPGAY